MDFPTAQFSSTSTAPDVLLVGSRLPYLTAKRTLKQSATPYVRGSVLGVLVGAVAAAVAAAGNTGNGTVSAPAAGAGVEPGTYQLFAVSATRFRVEAPSGRTVGVATVGTPYAGPLGFTITAGGTAFAAGDRFTVDVAAGATRALVAAAATDGSHAAVEVLAADVDATAGDAEGVVYTLGEVNKNALVLGAGLDAEAVRPALRARGIYLHDMRPA